MRLVVNGFIERLLVTRGLGTVVTPFDLSHALHSRTAGQPAYAGGFSSVERTATAFGASLHSRSADAAATTTHVDPSKGRELT